ncbi:hypothetical protein JOC76_000311 [Neobacillus cucumis]|nr:hypothetical protein [Neobacillus cucumis]
MILWKQKNRPHASIPAMAADVHCKRKKHFAFKVTGI